VTASARIYSIGALGRMLGVSPATLRSWEERYGVVVPERSAGSQRLYSRDDLDLLEGIEVVEGRVADVGAGAGPGEGHTEDQEK